jgi:probable F420-dependent oxidoreductase
MRIGLALPHYDYSFPDGKPLTWARLVEAARKAEAFGFDSAWISDHFFTDISRYGGPPGAVGTVEPFTALAALATLTERIRLGTLVACAPFRHPAHVAKMATSIDLTSGGRFDLGIGAGWYEHEFEAFGYRYGSTGERFSMLEESVEVIHRLFGEDPLDFDGRHFQLAGAFNRPRPPRDGGPPIWVGGKGGDRQFRLVARHASGWNSVWRWTPDDYAQRATRLREIAESEGRDPATVRLSVGLYALIGDDDRDLVSRYRHLQRWTPGGALDGESIEDFARNSLTGPPETCLARLEEFADIGVEEVIVSMASLPFAIYDWDDLELMAESVLPRAHAL